MTKKERSRKIFKIVEIVALSLVVALFVGAIILELAFPDASIAVWVKANIWDATNAWESFKAQIPELIQSLMYVVIVVAVCKLLRFIFKNRMRKNDRAKTVFTLLDGFIKYAGAIVVIILVLKAFGVDTTALIASVGVLTLVVGLGAQPLIADIIAGIFIIFENEYNVGEIVSIDDFRGTVLEIGVRSTKLLDAAGNIKIVNNNDIVNIVNLSRELSLAVVDCDFPYDVPLELIENLFEKNFEGMRERIPAIIDGPYYKGVCMYKDSNVCIKIVAQCKEEDRFQVQRDMMREYRAILTANNIDIAYPQVVINQPEKKEIKRFNKKKADEFTEGQKELSKDLEEQEGQ